MIIRKKIKVLIVDDSLMFREILARNISQDDSIEVIATATDPYVARDKIIEFEPDVMTLDVEMPRMNGIEFLRRLMPQYPIPVVVVSSANHMVFDALNAGAVDFVVKPEVSSFKGIDSFVNELIVKIKVASIATVSHWKGHHHTLSISNQVAYNDTKMIAIGASTGGTEAIHNILKMFSKEMPGVVVVQHMPPNFTRMYAERLNKTCMMEVKEAQDRDEIIPGRVLIAPGDYQMRVKKSGRKYIVECFKGERVNGHSPSVDVLFESIAQQVGSKAIGIILTGMGYDGAKGLLSMKKKGAVTIGQDEKSSVVYGMPKVAYNIGAVQEQVTLDSIAQAVYTVLKRK